MAKKCSLVALLLAFLVYHDTVCLPGGSPTFYAPVAGFNLKKLILKSIYSAKEEISLSIFSCTDRDVIAALNEKARQGCHITIEYDSRHSPHLNWWLDPSIQTVPRKGHGLMHKKLLTIDHTLTLLGSANFTLSSLLVHHNVVMGIHSPAYTRAAELGRPFVFCTGDQRIWTYHLPDLQALKHLLELIDRADRSIQCALFTLTHKEIIAALKRAHLRGVEVHIAIDKSSSHNLKKSCLPHTPFRGWELLHQKLALIDEKIVVFGSANWTKAAFERNGDLMVVIDQLTRAQLKVIKQSFPKTG